MRVPDGYAGKRVVCPQCSGIVLIPGLPAHLKTPYDVAENEPPGTASGMRAGVPAPRTAKAPAAAVSWVDAMRASKIALISALLIIAFGTAWMLDALDIITGWRWVWPLALGGVGVMIPVFHGLNKQTLLVGPYLVVAAIFALMRQNGWIELKVEIPALVLAFGVVLLIVTVAGYSLPTVIEDP